MNLVIRDLRKRDFNKAIQFAITGMHFHWYLDKKFLRNLYGKYYWYSEMSRATQVIAAYVGDELAGVLLADIKGEKKKYHSFWKSLFVKVFDIIQSTFYKDSVGLYDEAYEEMFIQYTKKNSPDGEITFLAAAPESKVKGIGSRLLEELEYRQNGKKIYLYTDNACTYQFYEHRGFECCCEKDIVMSVGRKNVQLTCLLYSKVIGFSSTSK